MSKKINKKTQTARISVTLPIEMLENFHILSEETDLSVSRLIYLRLRKRGSIFIVPEEVLQEIKSLRNLLDDIELGNLGNLSYETFDLLKKRVVQFEKLVSLDSPDIVVHVKRR